MKFKLLFFILLLSSLYSCAKKQQESLHKTGLLWEITGNGLKSPSYLFGTYHERGGMQILDSIKNFDSIFNTTEQLLCEKIIGSSKVQNPTLALSRIIKPWPVADSTYENILSDRQKKTLDSLLLSDKFLTFQKQSNLRPLVLLSSIRYSYNITRMKVSKDYKPGSDTVFVVLDAYLQYKAKKRGMNIVALDSEEERRKIYESLCSGIPQLSYKAEADYLMDYVENHSAIDSTIKAGRSKILSIYLKQNIQHVENSDFNNTLFPFEKEFSEKRDNLFVDERNSNWIKKIPELIAGKPCFIAVGAAHLGGEEGLINQLRESGYTVTSIEKTQKK